MGARTGRTRHARRRSRLATAGTIITLIGVLMVAVPFLPSLTPTTSGTTTDTEGGPDMALLDKARDYDRRLLEGGADMVGETITPFNGTTTGQPAYQTDTDYQNQLRRGDRMATIRIPTISVDLPIGHGTSPQLLDTAAGHLYGTTLPVGDEGNTVIAAHRGLNTRLLFRRLGELKPGDLIWTSTAGKDTAWRVTGTWKVDPGSREEREAIAVTPGHAWLTLYTCDPPGLNTRRLVVRAERTDLPPPSGVDAWRADPWRVGVTTVGGLAALAGTVSTARRGPRRRHAPPAPGTVPAPPATSPLFTTHDDHKEGNGT